MGNRYDSGFAKQSLKDKLTAIILLESSKSYEEMDGDLVTECVDFLMELEGKEKLTNEEICRRVQNIPFKGKSENNQPAKKKIRTKVLVAIAAALAVLITLFGIVGLASGDTFDMLLRKLGNEFSALFDEGPIELDGRTLYLSDEEKAYSSIKALVEAEGTELLYPSWMPENEKIIEIFYDSTNGIGEYILQCNNTLHSINITVNCKVAEDIKNTCAEKEIDGKTVYYFTSAQYVQANFEYKNNAYAVKADSEENLFKIIKNLEEIT